MTNPLFDPSDVPSGISDSQFDHVFDAAKALGIKPEEFVAKHGWHGRFGRILGYDRKPAIDMVEKAMVVHGNATRGR